MKFFGSMESRDGTILVELDNQRQGIQSAQLMALNPQGRAVELDVYEFEYPSAESFVEDINEFLSGY